MNSTDLNCPNTIQSIAQIDKKIHEKARLAIVATLATRKERTFQALKGDLGMSDGNLLTHLRTLLEAGYIADRKILQERTQTCYSLTAAGKNAFHKYLDVLEKVVRLKRR